MVVYIIIATPCSPAAMLGEEATLERTQVDPYHPPPRRVDQVVLVGGAFSCFPYINGWYSCFNAGATRMPAVRELVLALTGCVPRTDVDPEHAVALGCALQAGMLTGDVLGLEVMDGAYVQDAHQRVSGFVGWTP